MKRLGDSSGPVLSASSGKLQVLETLRFSAGNGGTGLLHRTWQTRAIRINLQGNLSSFSAIKLDR